MLKNLSAFALVAPIAMAGFTTAACDSPSETIGQTSEEIIGGFPARSSRLNAIGSLGFRLEQAPIEDLNDPEAEFRKRGYVNKDQRVLADDTYFPFCSATLISPTLILP